MDSIVLLLYCYRTMDSIVLLLYCYRTMDSIVPLCNNGFYCYTVMEH